MDDLSISNYLIFAIIYDKRDDFDFNNVKFPFWAEDVLHATSYVVFFFLLIQCVRASSQVGDFNNWNKI